MTKQTVEPLHQFTGYLLRRAFVMSAQCAQECIPADAHVREVAVLSILAERGAMSQRSLGDITHVNRSLIVKLVDTLESKGWVIRGRSETDRRTYALALTASGSAALTELSRDLDRGEAALTQTLTPVEVERLKRWLTKLLADDLSLDVGPLADRVGYLIAHAHRKLRGLAEERLGPLGLHPRDFGMLGTLAAEQPCSQSQLAGTLGISAPGVLPLVDDLEAAGLVVRVRNANDRRVYDLTLTSTGHERLIAARRAAAGLQEEVAQLLGAEADHDLRELLAKIIA